MHRNLNTQKKSLLSYNIFETHNGVNRFLLWKEKEKKQITKQYTTEYLHAIVIDMHIRIQRNIDCIVVCMHVHVCIFPAKMINMIFIFVI